MKNLKGGFFDIISKLDAQTRFLGLLSLSLGVALLLESLAIVKLYSSKEVVILPPNVQKPLWFAGNIVSADYLKQVGVYIANIIMNVSPDTVSGIEYYISPFFDPSDQVALNKWFQDYVREIKKNNYYQSFRVTNVYLDMQKNNIIVVGQLQRSVATLNPITYQGTVTIHFDINHGRFFVKSITVQQM